MPSLYSLAPGSAELSVKNSGECQRPGIEYTVASAVLFIDKAIDAHPPLFIRRMPRFERRPHLPFRQVGIALGRARVTVTQHPLHNLDPLALLQ
jgi:hypothetical protein